MSRPFQEKRNSQDLWMGLGTVSEVVSVRRCAKSVKPKVRDPPAVESGQPEGERVNSASSPLAPRQFLTTCAWCWRQSPGGLPAPLWDQYSMNMRTRLGAALFSVLALLVVVVTAHWVLTARPDADATLATVVFGLACTFLGPVTLGALYLALGLGQSDLVTRLTRVPAIADLMAQGDSAAGRVTVLQQQIGDLERIIQSEVQRGLLLEQRTRLTAEATTILANLDAVESVLGQAVPPLDPTTKEAIDALRQRLDAVRRGDIVINVGKRGFVIDVDALRLLPFGDLLVVYMRQLARTTTKSGRDSHH